MTRYFTTYWTAPPWEGGAYGQVGHAASNEFAARGVEPGDHLFVVHYHKRVVFLGARLVVERVTTKAAAAAALELEEDEIWDARDHVLADPLQMQRLDPNRVVPRDVLHQLSFIRSDGTESGVVFDQDGAANQQTLRTVRELTSSSSAMLDELIEWDTSPAPSQILTMLLTRGACYGECPEYTLFLGQDGFVGWTGERFVDRVGLHIGEITADAFRDLAGFAVEAGFFDLEEEYPPPATDLPAYELVIATGARDTRVRVWGGSAPPVFVDLAERLDRVAEDVEWTALETDDGQAMGSDSQGTWD